MFPCSPVEGSDMNARTRFRHTSLSSRKRLAPRLWSVLAFVCRPRQSSARVAVGISPLNYAHKVVACVEVNGTKLPRGRHYGSVPCRLRKKIQRCGEARTDVEAGMNPQGSPLTSRDSENRVRSYDRQAERPRACVMGVPDDRHPFTTTTASQCVETKRIPQLYRRYRLNHTASMKYGSGVFPAVVLDPRRV